MAVAVSLAMGMSHVQAQSPHNTSWQQPAEARLQAIYTRGEFRAQKFQPEWLSDSSGYTVEERDPTTDQLVRRSYDVRAGLRTEAKSGEGVSAGRGPLLSPDGKSVLEFQEKNIFVRDLAGGQRTQLTKRSTDRDLTYRNPVWSPDGTRIVFVESDSTHVRQRAVLTPDDPSYPGVRHNRFARVGEELAKLRIGVVDAAGMNMQWLPIESPAEGFYLGQVEWAGNSAEVLVEKFSRFRDQREFLLAKTDGNVRRIYHEANEAWAESSQGIPG